MLNQSLRKAFGFIIFIALGVILFMAITMFVKVVAVILVVAFLMWLIWVMNTKKTSTDPDENIT